MKTALFDFDLPEDRIATEPANPRDSARMLVVDNASHQDRFITDILAYIKPGDVMVFNDTKVIPARIIGKRGEARITITLLRHRAEGSWEAFAKPSKKIVSGDKLLFPNNLEANILTKREGGLVELSFNNNDIAGYLEQYGEMPLPPYMKRQARSEDILNYQTVYAKHSGAVAAPTAGLHFTDDLLRKLDSSGITRVFVTLHVGAGTFQPVKAEDTEAHIMHSEYAMLSEETAQTINKCRVKGGRVIAVGTTSLRTLESAAADNGQVKAYSGETDIFITPGYTFKAVDMLLTNFHLPCSTLFMLVSAFMGLERMKDAYSHAIATKYRFYSYGDGCLLIR